MKLLADRNAYKLDNDALKSVGIAGLIDVLAPLWSCVNCPECCLPSGLEGWTLCEGWVAEWLLCCYNCCCWGWVIWLPATCETDEPYC